VDATRINDQLDTRLRELIDNHVNTLRAEFQRLLGELPLHVDDGEPAGQEPLADTLARLKESVDAIHGSRGQREMAHRLLDAASRQAARTALMLARGDRLVGFEARGFNPEAADGFGDLRLEPLEADPLRRALSGRQTLHMHGSSLDGSALAEWLPGEQPEQVCMAPVVVGDRTVALLYGDSGPAGDGGRIHPEAVEILASVAAMYLERMRRPATAADAAAAASDGIPESARATADDDDGADAGHVQEAAPDGDSPAEDRQGGIPVAATDPEPGSDWGSEEASGFDPAATHGVTSDDPTETRIMETEAPAPAFDPAATMAVTDQEPAAGPREDSQPEEDARRFARLLVSEIVLYNEAQVKIGQKSGDLYSRLREAIDRSREAYEERFGAGSVRFFEDELVHTLAGGDRALLGDSYPGA
jgi:hypothetical protein